MTAHLGFFKVWSDCTPKTFQIRQKNYHYIFLFVVVIRPVNGRRREMRRRRFREAGRGRRHRNPVDARPVRQRVGTGCDVRRMNGHML